LLTLSAIILGCEILLVYICNSKMEAYSTGWWFFYISPWLRIFDYGTGLIGGLIFISIKRDDCIIVSKILFNFLELATLAIFIGSIYYSRYVPYPSLVMSAYYTPFSVILIFIYSFQKGVISWLFSRTIFVYLGDMSFTIFMLHQIMIGYTAAFFLSPIFLFKPEARHLASQLLLLLNVIIVCDFIFRYFEEPIRKKILSEF
jgi:peptidoglycan/LPS O-acetylase OafA/YrhL